MAGSIHSYSRRAVAELPRVAASWPCAMLRHALPEARKAAPLRLRASAHLHRQQRSKGTEISYLAFGC